MIEFNVLRDLVSGITLLDEDNLTALYSCLQQVEIITGDVAEVGVYKGGSARFMMSALPSKHFWLFDTFRGLPYADEGCHAQGDFSVVPDSLPALLDEGKYTLIPGLFPTTIVGNDDLASTTFALVHLDVDCHQSVVDGLDFFWPKLNSGGMILIHDYGWFACPGVKTAVDDFVATLETATYTTEIVGSEGHTQYFILKKG